MGRAGRAVAPVVVPRRTRRVPTFPRSCASLRLRARARHTLLLLGAFALVVAGCDSRDDSSGSPVSLRADGDRVEFVGGGASIVQGQLSLGAADTGGSPSVGFLVAPAEGTYDIEGDHVFAFYQSGETYTAVRGTVTVQTLDGDSVSGTFAFDAEAESGEAIAITQGRFDVERFE